jgi:hypothetical protein
LKDHPRKQSLGPSSVKPLSSGQVRREIFLLFSSQSPPNTFIIPKESAFTKCYKKLTFSLTGFSLCDIFITERVRNK